MEYSNWKNYVPPYCNNDTTSCIAHNYNWTNKYNLGCLEIDLKKNENSQYQPKDKLIARDELIKKYINADINSHKPYLGGSRRRRLSKRRSNKKKSIRRKRR